MYKILLASREWEFFNIDEAAVLQIVGRIWNNLWLLLYTVQLNIMGSETVRMRKIILASRSPRRMELLKDAGIPFDAIPADIPETAMPDEGPIEFVRRLAAAKADHVSAQRPNDIVLGADTIVYLDGRIIGKPKDIEDAKAILTQLSGNKHLVYTGVSLSRRNTEFKLTWHSATAVTFKTLSSADIRQCLSTGDPLDKAGAYAIQEHEGRLIAEYDGLRSNVIGLPIEEVLDKLIQFASPAIQTHVQNQ